MTPKEASNIIICLTQEGWSAEQINAFLVYIETHTPTEAEAREIIEKAKKE